jgi:hypothetical protein
MAAVQSLPAAVSNTPGELQYSTLWHLFYLQTLEHQRGYARGMNKTALVRAFHKCSLRPGKLLAV